MICWSFFYHGGSATHGHILWWRLMYLLTQWHPAVTLNTHFNHFFLVFLIFVPNVTKPMYFSTQKDIMMKNPFLSLLWFRFTVVTYFCSFSAVVATLVQHWQLTRLGGWIQPSSCYGLCWSFFPMSEWVSFQNFSKWFSYSKLPVHWKYSNSTTHHSFRYKFRLFGMSWFFPPTF